MVLLRDKRGKRLGVAQLQYTFSRPVPDHLEGIIGIIAPVVGHRICHSRDCGPTVRPRNLKLGTNVALGKTIYQNS